MQKLCHILFPLLLILFRVHNIQENNFCTFSYTLLPSRKWLPAYAAVVGLSPATISAHIRRNHSPRKKRAVSCSGVAWEMRLSRTVRFPCRTTVGVALLIEIRRVQNRVEMGFVVYNHTKSEGILSKMQFTVYLMLSNTAF